MTCPGLDDCTASGFVIGEHHVRSLMHDLADSVSMCSIPALKGICLHMDFEVRDEHGRSHHAHGSTGYECARDPYCECCCMVDKVETLICCVASELLEHTGQHFVVDYAEVNFVLTLDLDLDHLLPMFHESDVLADVCLIHTAGMHFRDQADEYRCGELACEHFHCFDADCHYHGIEEIVCGLIYWLEEIEHHHHDPACRTCCCDHMTCHDL
jgi:hypothetical protein